MVEISELVETLRQSELFGLLDDSLLTEAATSCSVEYQRAGFEQVRAGETNGEVFLLIKGAAELRNADGELVARYAEGDVMGLVSASTGRPARNTSVFIEDSVFARFDWTTLARLRHRSPAFDQRLISIVDDRAMTERADRGSLRNIRPTTLSVAAGTLSRREPVTAVASTTVSEGANIMTAGRVSSLLIVDDDGRLVGIVTDRDLRQRVVATGLDPATPVAHIMTDNPLTIEPETPAYQAMLAMTERNVHHLPLIDGDGRPRGMVSSTDLHMASTSDPVFVVGEVSKACSVDEVMAATARVPTMIQQLMEADALAETVGRLVTSVTDAASRRLAHLAEAKFGVPPVEYAFVCFGSQARQEQTALSDQDNALILARDPSDEERAYFAQWADFVCDGLAAAGYRHCPGEIMATNPRWVAGLDTWKDFVTSWVNAPSPDAVLNAAVFFDVRHLCGRADVTAEYRDWSLSQAATHPNFLGHLAAAGVAFKPPIGFFRRFVVEKDGEHRDRLDLKGRGVTPVIELARVLALAHRIEATNTFDRLRALGPTSALAPEDALDLLEALEHIGYYRLQHQRRQIAAGRPADNFLNPDDLSRLEREDLKRAFVTIAAHQDGLRRRFDTGAMG
ncbi:MAG: DUF294 nucleotidyltransferase-like domain-containing protein [Acidimicrobiia bacterium]|nr:DUF294 nucleotidyltransferase-like domain-containing protein [Acidimicrobiia bacterium]